MDVSTLAVCASVVGNRNDLAHDSFLRDRISLDAIR
jgi:hypothetical protein